MPYLLITVAICLIYNTFLFRYLGRWRFHITLGMSLAGVAVLGISELYLEGYAWFVACFIGFVLCVGMALCLLNHAEDWKKLRCARRLATLPARRLKSVEDTFSLSRRDMLDNFRELAAEDNMANYAPEQNFLAWNDEQGLDIRIRLLPGEDWVGLLYLTDYELRDSEIKAACRKVGVPCQPELLGMAPSGLVICRDGRLTITPAAQKKGFDELCERVLAPRHEFSAWLREYTEKD